ncbi:unnamed protein product [Cylicocyclus nassatus]|uniref:C2H2-type domain-containing protein n=1 Tax=Cylicocyclus nassatus TaxID=53992 RepID=A0AA36DVL7_CYLNA|nr:unnamed protein product [Cylicocyclus nassatus]
MVLQTKPAAMLPFSTVADLEEFMMNASNRMTSLMREECTLIFQCRCCANMFRRLPNFILHKRKYCKNKSMNVCNSKIRILARSTSQESGTHTASRRTQSVCSRSSSVPQTRHQSKPSFPIRRTNIVRYIINKASLVESKLTGNMGTTDLISLPKFRRQVVVAPTSDGNTKCYVEAPHVCTKYDNSDEVLLVVPQDLSLQYSNMSLRRRTAQPVARKVTISEAECVSRMKDFVEIDPIECRCLHPRCSEIRAFGDIFALAYHVSVKHCHKITPANVLPCMICSKSFISWETYYNHISKKHEKVLQAHRFYRDNELKKRGRKSKDGGKTDRSMSPVVSGRERDENEAAHKENMVPESSFPVLPSPDPTGATVALNPPKASATNTSRAKPSSDIKAAAERLESIVKRLAKLRTDTHITLKPSTDDESSAASSHVEEHLGSVAKSDTVSVHTDQIPQKEPHGNADENPEEAAFHDTIASSASPLFAHLEAISDDELPLSPQPAVISDDHPSRPVAESKDPPSPHPATISCEPPSPQLVTISDDEIDVVDSDVTEVAGVVQDDAPLSHGRKDNEVSAFDEWEGASTRACKSSADDDDVVFVGQYSVADNLPSCGITECDVVGSDSIRRFPSTQSSYLCGGEDYIEDVDADVDNLSTTVFPGTSNSYGSSESDYPHHVESQADKSQETEEIAPPHVGSPKVVELESQVRVAPAPAPSPVPEPVFVHDYTKLLTHAEIRERLGDGDGGLTSAENGCVSDQSTFQNGSSMSVPPPFFIQKEETSSYGLKRPQSEPVMYGDEKKSVSNTHVFAEYRATPYSYSTSNVYQTVPPANPIAASSPASYAYSMATMAIPPSEQPYFQQNCGYGGQEGLYVNPVTYGDNLSRQQKCQRTRRLPARYRDDRYVCTLGDGGRSNEVTSQSGLSSGQYNLSGTRWNAVFSSLQPLISSLPRSAQYCGDCGHVYSPLEMARRHVLSHIRLVRFVCKLCGAGGFFATDLQAHLMKGHCAYFQRTEAGLPPRNAAQAESLCEYANADNPGEVVLLEGESRMVSSANTFAHKPDEEIERRILARCV